MLKLVIKKINNYNYTLVDKNNKEYNINIEFYGLNTLPKETDIIYMDEKLLHSINNNIVSFGHLDEKYGKEIITGDEEDLIILSTNNEKIYLKRFYG